MTRGTGVLILADKLRITDEFNGDMYFVNYGWGKEFFEAVKNSQSEKEFDKAMKDFNKEHHNYEDFSLHTITDNVEEMLDMSKNYFENWFSDYLYIKNLSGEDKKIISKENNETYTLHNGETIILCFGEIEPGSGDNDIIGVEKITKGYRVKIDVGSIWVYVEAESEDNAICEVEDNLGQYLHNLDIDELGAEVVDVELDD